MTRIIGPRFYVFLFGVIFLTIIFYVYTAFDSSELSETVFRRPPIYPIPTSYVAKTISKDHIDQNKVTTKIRPAEDLPNHGVGSDNSAKHHKTLQNAAKELLVKQTLKDPTVRKIVPYKLGDQDIDWVEWENKCVLPPDLNTMFEDFNQFVCPGSNAIDIGAHSGDTAVPIAAATRGGITYAYEPHPKTYHILKLQEDLNPKLGLKAFNIALMKDSRNKLWWNGVGDGCNGGIQGTSCGSPNEQCMEIKSEDVATHFNKAPRDFFEKLSFIKVDTEGNDRYILRGLKDSILRRVRPLILIEWFTSFRNCNDDAKDLFSAIHEIDYKPYGFHYQLETTDMQEATCDKYVQDLLLLPKEVDIKKVKDKNGIKICPS